MANPVAAAARNLPELSETILCHAAGEGAEVTLHAVPLLLDVYIPPVYTTAARRRPVESDVTEFQVPVAE
jgi:hypothetical protein